MAKRKSPDENPNHRMGKRCGYSQEGDGTIIPAPMYADELARISNQVNGINDMLKMVSSTASDMLAEVDRRRKELWDRICDDYNLNRETHDIFYNGHAIKLSPKKGASDPTDERR